MCTPLEDPHNVTIECSLKAALDNVRVVETGMVVQPPVKEVCTAIVHQAMYLQKIETYVTP